MSYLDNEFRQAFRNLMWPERTRGFNAGKWLERCAAAGATTAFVDMKTQAYALYDSKVAKRDPALDGKDLGEEISKAAKELGMKWCAYIAPCTFESLGETRQEWQQRLEDGSLASNGWGAWKTVYCWNSPYRDFLLSMISEIAAKYKPHGFYIDGVLFDFNGCYCERCRTRFLKETGLALPKRGDWSSKAWISFLEARRRWLAEAAGAIAEAAHSVDPEISVVLNSHCGVSGWHAANSHAQARAVDMLCAEITPRGSSFLPWTPDGFSFGDLISWFCAAQRAAKDGARNQLYSYFTPETRVAEMEFIADMAVATGSLLCVQEHRDDIAEIFARMKEAEPFLRDVEPMFDIALHYGEATQRAFWNSPSHDRNDPFFQEVRGVYKALSDARRPPEIVDDDGLEEGNLRGARTLLLPNSVALSEKAKRQVRAFAENGGSVVALAECGAMNEAGERGSGELLFEGSGLKSKGLVETRKPFLLKHEASGILLEDPVLANPAQFLVFKNGSVAEWIGEDVALSGEREPLEARETFQLPEEPSLHLPAPALKIEANAAWRVDASLRYVDAASGATLESPAALSRSFGKGRLVYASFPLGALVMKTGHPWWKNLLMKLVGEAAPPQEISVDAPPCVKTAFWRKNGCALVHLVNELNSAPCIRHQIERRLPVEIELAAPVSEFERPELALAGCEAKIEESDGLWKLRCRLESRAIVICRRRKERAR